MVCGSAPADSIYVLLAEHGDRIVRDEDLAECYSERQGQPSISPSVVRFRARLSLHGKERLVFERSIELATELELLEGQCEQIVDSMPMLGAAAVQDTAVLVRTAVGKLIDAVAAADTHAARKLVTAVL